MNILLTASFDKGIFTNGLQQNIIFIAEMLIEIGLNVTISVNHDVDKSIDPPNDILIINQDKVIECNFDFVLNTSWMLSDKVINILKRKNKKLKNIHIHYGNKMMADIEQCRTDNSCLGTFMVDEIWISPHYKNSISYLKTLYNNEKVFILPYIWSSKYIDLHEKIWNKAGKSCKYNSSREKNIAIIEPNLNMTKNCIPSIMIAESLFKDSPNDFGKVSVYCSNGIKEKKYFRSLMWNLDLTKNKRIFFETRRNFSQIFSSECSFIISHQLMNGLNYTYLEAFHLNIPVIHNSPYVQNCGYYYPDYNIEIGSKQLKNALESHEDNLDVYHQNAKEIISRYSPQNPEVIKLYEKLFGL